MGTGMFLSWSILVIHFRIVTKSASIILCYIMEEEVFELFLLLSIFVILDFFLNSLRGHPLSTSPSRLEDGVTDLVVIWGHCIFWPFFGDMVDGEGRVKKREKSGDILKGWPLTVQLQSWYQCPMISNSERINFEKKICISWEIKFSLRILMYWYPYEDKFYFSFLHPFWGGRNLQLLMRKWPESTKVLRQSDEEFFLYKLRCRIPRVRFWSECVSIATIEHLYRLLSSLSTN